MPELTTDHPDALYDLNDDLNDEHDWRCSYCGGDGWGIVGTDWDTDDAINGPYNGETERCPCCNGSGRAKDMIFC